MNFISVISDISVISPSLTSPYLYCPSVGSKQ